MAKLKAWLLVSPAKATRGRQGVRVLEHEPRSTGAFIEISKILHDGLITVVESKGVMGPRN